LVVSGDGFSGCFIQQPGMIDNRARMKTKKYGRLLPKTGNKLLSAECAFGEKSCLNGAITDLAEPAGLNPLAALAQRWYSTNEWRALQLSCAPAAARLQLNRGIRNFIALRLCLFAPLR
jgi:hypothetical protein